VETIIKLLSAEGGRLLATRGQPCHPDLTGKPRSVW